MSFDIKIKLLFTIICVILVVSCSMSNMLVASITNNDKGSKVYNIIVIIFCAILGSCAFAIW